MPVSIELHDAEAFGVLDVIAEHGGPALVLARTREMAPQAVSVEDVVAQDERTRIAVDEVLADEERLGKAIGRRLHRIVKLKPELRAVLQKVAEVRQILWRAYDQDVPDARQHERR